MPMLEQDEEKKEQDALEAADPPPPPPPEPSSDVEEDEAEADEELDVADARAEEIRIAGEEFDDWWALRVEEGADDDDVVLQVGDITLDTVRDGVVSKKTLDMYGHESLTFLSWCQTNRPDWLTAVGTGRLQRIKTRREGERTRAFQKRMYRQLKTLLRRCSSEPLLVLHRITPESFMDYVMSNRRDARRGGGYLGKSAYGNKRSAFNHLFRCHNRRGFPEDFNSELGNLYRGFYRNITFQRQIRRRHQQEQQQQEVDGNEDGDDGQDNPNLPLGVERENYKEGKDPMSVDLYQRLARWFIEWNTTDGIWGFCFLVLTWNLACRANNTALISVSQVAWASSFDSFEIVFGHTKMGQSGDDAKYPRHLYANPKNPLSCPVFALALYFSTCFNTPLVNDSLLFPGNDQYQRFSKMLVRMLNEHEEEVSNLGYRNSDLGTHSIRKGAVSYLASLPGGPPAAAICIRAGWTMGKVRDIYMRYITSGDEFVGRSLSLLPLLSVDFGASPPYFSVVHEEWGVAMCANQFPMLNRLATFRRMLLMCLASVCHHRVFVLDLVPNHVVRLTSQIHRSAGAMQRFDDDAEVVVVTHPWNDARHIFTGIPPHVSVLQELTLVKVQQRELLDTFVSKVKQAIDESGVGGGVLTEARLRVIFDDFATSLEVRLNRLEVGAVVAAAERVETNTGYRWHMHGGKFHRVPADWRFPRIGVFDLWKQWWIGDTVRGVPPLKTLQVKDLEHLDAIPLSEEEQHGRTGRNKERRQPSRAIFFDMTYLMTYITTKVTENGGIPLVITDSAVVRMFELVGGVFLGGRNAQKRWSTVSNEVQKRAREHRQAIAA